MILALAAVPLLLLQLLVSTTVTLMVEPHMASPSTVRVVLLLAIFHWFVRSFVRALPCRHRHRETDAAALKNRVEV